MVNGGASSRVAVTGDIIAGILVDNNWAGIIKGNFRESRKLTTQNLAFLAWQPRSRKAQKRAQGKQM